MKKPLLNFLRVTCSAWASSHIVLSAMAADAPAPRTPAPPRVSAAAPAPRIPAPAFSTPAFKSQAAISGPVVRSENQPSTIMPPSRWLTIPVTKGATVAIDRETIETKGSEVGFWYKMYNAGNAQQAELDCQRKTLRNIGYASTPIAPESDAEVIYRYLCRPNVATTAMPVTKAPQQAPVAQLDPRRWTRLTNGWFFDKKSVANGLYGTMTVWYRENEQSDAKMVEIGCYGRTYTGGGVIGGPIPPESGIELLYNKVCNRWF